MLRLPTKTFIWQQMDNIALSWLNAITNVTVAFVTMDCDAVLTHSKFRIEYTLYLKYCYCYWLSIGAHSLRPWSSAKVINGNERLSVGSTIERSELRESGGWSNFRRFQLITRALLKKEFLKSDDLKREINTRVELSLLKRMNSL